MDIFIIVISFVPIFLIGFVAGMAHQAQRLEKAGIIKIVGSKMRAKE